MNANELIKRMEDGYSVSYDEIITMLRQQQAEIEELEKENTDLRYLIATKLEQQDGISLNSMAHPITNTPEPSYEINPDKLETIEIDLPSPEPVAWINVEKRKLEWDKPTLWETPTVVKLDRIPLYTHPSEHDIGISHAIGFDDGFKAGMQRAVEMNVVKELTDEKILKMAADMFHYSEYRLVIDFARAILRRHKNERK